MAKTGNRPIAIVFIFMAAMLLPGFSGAEEAGPQAVSQEENKIEYKSEDLRNPFEEEKIETKSEPQEDKEAKPLPELQVQAVVWGGKVPLAIINDRVVRLGDTIEGVRIDDISKSGVSVFFGNSRHNLTTSTPTTSKGSGGSKGKSAPEGESAPQGSQQGAK